MYLDCIIPTLLALLLLAVHQRASAIQQQSIFKRSSGLVASSSQLPCPSSCVCKWSNGKPSAFCDSQNLISIPNGIDSEVQVLDLSKNNFQTLPSRVFQEKRLTNLQKINLAYCNLANLADDAFMQLTNLVELDLANNLLTKVPIVSTRECKQLRKLHLSHNPITTIERQTFVALNELTMLDLSYCQLDSIEPMAFYGLNNLKELKLNDNRLHTLEVAVVANLPPNIYIDFTQNQWNCDCHLRALKDWYSSTALHNSLPPTCSQPSKHAYVMWKSLKEEEFACAPEIIPGNTDMTLMAGQNISLSCTVKASLPVSFVWFQDERNITDRGNQSEPPRTTQLLEERRYDIYETMAITQTMPNISTSVLTLYNLRPTDSSTFLCWVENKAGYSVTNFTLTVTEPGAMSDMWPGWSRRTDSTYMIMIIIIAMSLLLATIIVLLLVKRRNNNNNNNNKEQHKSKELEHDMKVTTIARPHCHSVSSADDDSTSTDSSDSSTRKPQISSIGLDVIEHMKSGIINMDYHSMSPIIHYNTTNHSNPAAIIDNELTNTKKNELRIQPGNQFIINYNTATPNNNTNNNNHSQSANSSYNCDLTSSSTTGYHSDYQSGYSDEPNSGPNYNMMIAHDPHQNLISNRMGLMSTLDRQRHHIGYHPGAYETNRDHQPPDVTMIHGPQHQHPANYYQHNHNGDMSEMTLPAYAITDRQSEMLATPLDYSNNV